MSTDTALPEPVAHVERLRSVKRSNLCLEAADLIEALDEENSALRVLLLEALQYGTYRNDSTLERRIATAIDAEI